MYGTVHNNSTLYALYNRTYFISIPCFNFVSEAFSLLWAFCPTLWRVMPPYGAKRPPEVKQK